MPARKDNASLPTGEKDYRFMTALARGQSVLCAFAPAAITSAIRAAVLSEPYDIPFATRGCFQYAGEIAEIVARCTQATWQGALLSDLTTEVHSTDQLLAAILKRIPTAQLTASKNTRISPSEGFDNQPIKQVIGDWPKTSLEQGIDETIRLYRQWT